MPLPPDWEPPGRKSMHTSSPRPHTPARQQSVLPCSTKVGGDPEKGDVSGYWLKSEEGGGDIASVFLFRCFAVRAQCCSDEIG